MVRTPKQENPTELGPYIRLIPRIIPRQGSAYWQHYTQLIKVILQNLQLRNYKFNANTTLSPT